MKAPRGGGKSKLLGALAFALWYFRGLDVVDMGGSQKQAEIVYQYFEGHCYMDPQLVKQFPADPTQYKTESDLGNKMKCLPASPKQIRGPHPDVLLADEVCETKDELILDALPMVDTSPNPIIAMTSTFHKAFGIFQEYWDNANEYGYTRISWDIFDVTRSFDPSIWDDPELQREIPDLDKLKELAAGRTGEAEGWVNIQSIIQAWREKTSVDYFMVEYMGSRPATSGLVNNPEDVDNCVFLADSDSCYNYQDGAEVVAGLDWGWSGMTSWVPLMSYIDGIRVQLENRNYTKAYLSHIIDDIIWDVRAYGISHIYADAAGKFENQELRRRLGEENINCLVIEMDFGKYKNEMLGNYRAHFERQLLRIPNTHKTAIWQHKRYHFNAQTEKPVKEHDHVPDATMCALYHWNLTDSTYHIGDHPALPEDASTRPVTSGLRGKRF